MVDAKPKIALELSRKEQPCDSGHQSSLNETKESSGEIVKEDAPSGNESLFHAEVTHVDGGVVGEANATQALLPRIGDDQDYGDVIVQEHDLGGSGEKVVEEAKDPSIPINDVNYLERLPAGMFTSHLDICKIELPGENLWLD